jgi:1-acyl-sn-glycerol-3-phosphate acyltransferase
VSNHQSYLDGIVLLALLPRPPNFLIKSELKRSPALGRPLARLGALFVERFDAAAGIDGMREAANSLEVGAALTVFAEGTFKRMPGLLPFHMGAFTVAAEGGVAVVPVAIRGTRSILRARSWFLRRGCIAVAVGAPIVPPSGGPTWSRALTLRDAARAYILEHCGEPDLAHESNVVDDR